jgi:hypothetical protein
VKIIWIILLLPALALAEEEEVFLAPDAPIIEFTAEVESEDLEPAPAELTTPFPEEENALLATPVEGGLKPAALAAKAGVTPSSLPAPEEEEASAVLEASGPAMLEPPLGPTAEEGYGSIELKNEPEIVNVKRVMASEPAPSKPSL